MYAERETFGPASLPMVATRSSERVREVLVFILPLYYRSRISATIDCGIRDAVGRTELSAQGCFTLMREHLGYRLDEPFHERRNAHSGDAHGGWAD